MTLKTGPNFGRILGIKLISTSKAKVLRIVRAKIAGSQKFYIVTPNPEIVLSASYDKVLAKILNSAEISLPDGVGLAAAKKFLEMPNPKDPARRFLTLLAQGLGVGFSIVFDRGWLLSDFNLIRGREMFLELITLANKKGWSVFLLGDRQKSAQKAAEKLEYNFKKIKILASEGPNLNEDANPISKTDVRIEERAVKDINKVSPQLLFVGFGAPRQEKWVHKWLPKLNIGGAMVVGGAFDYISGTAELPPKWMAERGLEWLWRLLREPKRAERILAATANFPLKVFWYKLTNQSKRR